MSEHDEICNDNPKDAVANPYIRFYNAFQDANYLVTYSVDPIEPMGRHSIMEANMGVTRA